MRRLSFAVLSLVFAVTGAGDELCGTSAENDARVRGLHERVLRERGRIAVNADDSVATVRDGAFYLQTDDAITPGYRPFDLAGQSLVFTPSGASAFRVRREALRYTEPAGEALRDFQTATGPTWHYAQHDLGFTFPAFGRSVTRIYVTAFNGIHFDPPVEQKGMQFDAIEAFVHRAAVVSPLMITNSKPRFLVYPQVFVDSQPDAVRVTWRSTANAPFGYDVQAELRSDGTIVFSYRTPLAMRWGTPIVSPGFDAATVARATLRNVEDAGGDVINAVPSAVRSMLDIRRFELMRLGDSDLFAARLQLAQAIDRTKLAPGEILGFQASIDGLFASVEIDRVDVKVRSFTGARLAIDGAAARVDGNIVEIYGIQPSDSDAHTLRVASYFRPLNRITDQALTGIAFTAPARTVTSDLSAVSQDSTLPAPIAEPFVLGAFDPFTVWDRLRPAFGLSEYDYDAVAMYQSYFTDLIFFAGAYSTGGNPSVDGIAPLSQSYGRDVPRSPSLLHMNQLTYNYSTAPETASKVMLHEFGHRWLYFFSIFENGSVSRVLNPSSAHPAAYVNTPSAFPVYGPDESSVMGGGVFTQQPDGLWRAHAANMGFSWTDLYLMGLAAPEEVAPWFYLAGTDLPKEYWPTEGVVVVGQRRDVTITQVTDVHGRRDPSSALSQRKFRVLFVLVTEDAEPTAAEVAKLNEWRALLERNFAIATGGRGSLVTTFVRPAKKRAVR